MKMASLVWSYAKGEGFLRLNTEFYEAHRVVQLDTLVDWQAELREVYDALLRDQDRPAREVITKALRTFREGETP